MTAFSLSPAMLYARIGQDASPRVIDVCLCEDYDTFDRIIPASAWRDPLAVDRWVGELTPGDDIVITCVKGKKVSQAVAADLRARGFAAMILEGGITAWHAAGLPTVKKHLGVGARGTPPSRWVTRVRPKIDRIACPWLIARFIDPAARFFFVEPAEVIAAAKILNAIPYDVEAVELTHRNGGCTFDTLLDDFGLSDFALEYLRLIVRGADTHRLDLAPEAAGLLAVSLGISVRAGDDDHAALAQGFAVYDALYAWRRMAATETHNWPAKSS